MIGQDEQHSSECDPAHEADIRELMRQQLRDNITAEEAEEELEEYDYGSDEWYGAEDDYECEEIKMSNMSYCMFENTYKDLLDCVERLGEYDLDELSESEQSYAKRLARLCNRFADELDLNN